MPYYNWKGVDWYGTIHQGSKFARSANELEKLLLNQDIGLIESNQISYNAFLVSIPLNAKVQFFKELAVLVDSGVLLPNALSIVKNQIKNQKFKKIIEEIGFEVNEGLSLGAAIEKYPTVFDTLIIQLIIAGQESGKLSESIILLSNYLEKKEQFSKKFRSTMLLPLITFVFFIFISLIIFLFIIPSFSSIFSFSNQKIPALTQGLLDFSAFLKKNGLSVLIIVFSMIFICFYKIMNTKKGSLFINRLVLKTPFLGNLIKYVNLTYFLQSVSLLLDGGVHLLNALYLASNAIRNEYLKKDFLIISNSVEKGTLLSNAMSENNKSLFLPNLIAMTKVGEESGKLSFMLNRASELYYEKANRLLSFFITTIQPMLMIFLGILIALLIFAIYIPLFNLPNIIF